MSDPHARLVETAVRHLAALKSGERRCPQTGRLHAELALQALVRLLALEVRP